MSLNCPEKGLRLRFGAQDYSYSFGWIPWLLTTNFLYFRVVTTRNLHTQKCTDWIKSTLVVCHDQTSRRRIEINPATKKKTLEQQSHLPLPMSITYHRIPHAGNLAEPEARTNQQDPLNAISLVGAETFRTVTRQPGDYIQIMNFRLVERNRGKIRIR